MNPEKDSQTKFEEKFKELLKEQYKRGFNDGVKTISRVVLDKLNNTSMPLMKRIESAKRLCSTPFRENHVKNKDKNQ